MQHSEVIMCAECGWIQIYTDMRAVYIPMYIYIHTNYRFKYNLN